MPENADQFVRLNAALAERYRVERRLGGGMATVYLAHDLKHDRLDRGADRVAPFGVFVPSCTSR